MHDLPRELVKEVLKQDRARVCIWCVVLYQCVFVCAGGFGCLLLYIGNYTHHPFSHTGATAAATHAALEAPYKQVFWGGGHQPQKPMAGANHRRPKGVWGGG